MKFFRASERRQDKWGVATVENLGGAHNATMVLCRHYWKAIMPLLLLMLNSNTHLEPRWARIQSSEVLSPEDKELANSIGTWMAIVHRLDRCRFICLMGLKAWPLIYLFLILISFTSRGQTIG